VYEARRRVLEASNLTTGTTADLFLPLVANFTSFLPPSRPFSAQLPLSKPQNNSRTPL
jgi:hypothetical protein